jgi:hypothetical protein
MMEIFAKVLYNKRKIIFPNQKEVGCMEQVNVGVINWAVVCVSEFAKAQKLHPKAAFRYLYDFGGIEFIKEHYEAEHLLSFDDAVEDLGIVCRNNGGNL